MWTRVGCRQLIRLLAENMPLSPWAGLLARGFRRDLNPINADPAFPESEIQVAFLGQAHHSQWRDRSGFSPKFPFGPTTGTQGQSAQAYSTPVPGVKSPLNFQTASPFDVARSGRSVELRFRFASRLGPLRAETDKEAVKTSRGVESIPPAPVSSAAAERGLSAPTVGCQEQSWTGVLPPGLPPPNQWD